jgi:hypothetical protein
MTLTLALRSRGTQRPGPNRAWVRFACERPCSARRTPMPSTIRRLSPTFRLEPLLKRNLKVVLPTREQNAMDKAARLATARRQRPRAVTVSSRYCRTWRPSDRTRRPRSRTPLGSPRRSGRLQCSCSSPHWQGPCPPSPSSPPSCGCRSGRRSFSRACAEPAPEANGGGCPQNRRDPRSVDAFSSVSIAIARG